MFGVVVVPVERRLFPPVLVDDDPGNRYEFLSRQARERGKISVGTIEDALPDSFLVECV
jgi:hypothetical protein